MLETCVRAVRSLSDSSAAISLFARPSREQPQDLEFARRQLLGSRVDGCSVDIRRRATAGIELHLAAVRGADRGGHLVGIGVLEQVAGRARLERGLDARGLAV